jgi:hypothetical protein
LGVDETVRRPTISGYDNWELVKSHYVSSVDPESVDVSTLTKGEGDDDDDTNNNNNNNNNDVASAKSSSAASDWGVPTKNQNADDSSWVNPARPIDPERRDRIKSEVDRTFLRRLEQARSTRTAAGTVLVPYEPQTSPVQDSSKALSPFANEPANNVGGKILLSPLLATEPGSFDEDRGWVPHSKSVTKDMSSPDRDLPLEVLPLEDSGTWNMPRKATVKTASISRKAVEGAKDYRYTYITARPVSAEPNAVPSMSTYWDKVRQNYFDDRDIPVPTDGPATATSDSYSRPLWMDGGDRSVESGSWLPPGGINPSNRESYRSIPHGDEMQIRSPNRSVERVDHDVGNKSVVTSDSDWQPPGENARLRRVDFTGRVTTTYDNEQHGSGSSSSDDIPWVPNRDYISSVDGGEVKNRSEFVEEQRRTPSPSTGLPTSSFPTTTKARRASSSSNDDSGCETGSEYSMEDDVGSSVWTSGLRLEDDDDDDDDEDDSSHLSEQCKDSVPEEEKAMGQTVGNGGVATTERRQQQQQQQRPSNMQGRRSYSPTPPVRGIVRKTSNDSSSASIDSVLSYTGRIAFKTSPEVITFVDGPDEDRGTHYSRYGRTDLSRKRGSSSSSSSSSSYEKGPDPCIYYFLCCVMVAVPTIILIVMFTFVIDLDGDDGNSG